MDPTAASGAFLGPIGTFTELAAQRVRTLNASTLQAETDVATIAELVETGAVDFGVVPIENSVHGTVLPTLDTLVFDRENVLIREELVVDVAFTLYRNPTGNANATDAKFVLSHPHALAQCRTIIASLGLTTEESPSTAQACQTVSDARPDAWCIAGPTAGEHFGLVAHTLNVQDRDGGRTRFYVLARTLAARHDERGELRGEFKTALVLTPSRDRPGMLLELLRPFAERGLNLSSLMSRPLRSGLGLYCFVLVVDAHIDAQRFGAALSELLDNGVRIKNLGSYLAWPATAVEISAHAEVPVGSVGATDDPTLHAKVLQPSTDATRE